MRPAELTRRLHRLREASQHNSRTRLDWSREGLCRGCGGQLPANLLKEWHTTWKARQTLKRTPSPEAFRAQVVARAHRIDYMYRSWPVGHPHFPWDQLPKWKPVTRLDLLAPRMKTLQKRVGQLIDHNVQVYAMQVGTAIERGFRGGFRGARREAQDLSRLEEVVRLGRRRRSPVLAPTINQGTP